MANSPGESFGKQVKYQILSNGNDVTNKYPLKSIIIRHEVNRIGSAVISIVTRSMSDANVPESASDDFKPGKDITIELGYESNSSKVFEGIVIAQKIRIPRNNDASPLLIVECKNEAVKATVARKNRIFEKKKDSDAVKTALREWGISVEMDDTPVTHTQLVQYYCTDWDFALSRADVYGMLVTTNGKKIAIKKPQMSAAPVFSVCYGKDLLAFNGEVYAEEQFGKVSSIGWDPAQQKLVSVSSSPVSLNAQGNMSPNEMSSASGIDEVLLQTDALTDKNVLKEWADATLLKTGLSRFRGSFSFCGNSAAVPGCLIELNGMGARFNGKVFVGAVIHTFEDGMWVTEVEMGISPLNITQQSDVVAPLSSGLYPGIEGLHIGIVTKLGDDPDSAYRIQVEIPVMNTSPNTVWARLAQFAASNGVGSYFIPSVRDEVILGFINNDPNQAVILGCLYSNKNSVPYELDEQNYKRAIISPEKLKIEMDDEKKIMTLTTPGNNSIIINDDAKSITLKDQNKNELIMNDSGIKISSAKDIVLSAKGNIKQEATGNHSIAGKQGVKVEGLNIEIKAQTTVKVSGSASAELSASGQTTIKGAMVMIN